MDTSKPNIQTVLNIAASKDTEGPRIALSTRRTNIYQTGLEMDKENLTQPQAAPQAGGETADVAKQSKSARRRQRRKLMQKQRATLDVTTDGEGENKVTIGGDQTSPVNIVAKYDGTTQANVSANESAATSQPQNVSEAQLADAKKKKKRKRKKKTPAEGGVDSSNAMVPNGDAKTAQGNDSSKPLSIAASGQAKQPTSKVATPIPQGSENGLSGSVKSTTNGKSKKKSQPKNVEAQAKPARKTSKKQKAPKKVLDAAPPPTAQPSVPHQSKVSDVEDTAKKPEVHVPPTKSAPEAKFAPTALKPKVELSAKPAAKASAAVDRSSIYEDEDAKGVDKCECNACIIS